MGLEDTRKKPLPGLGSAAGAPLFLARGAEFALFLSHDIDQIRDREMWRLLGT